MISLKFQWTCNQKHMGKKGLRPLTSHSQANRSRLLTYFKAKGPPHTCADMGGGLLADQCAKLHFYTRITICLTTLLGSKVLLIRKEYLYETVRNMILIQGSLDDSWRQHTAHRSQSSGPAVSATPYWQVWDEMAQGAQLEFVSFVFVKLQY